MSLLTLCCRDKQLRGYLCGCVGLSSQVEVVSLILPSGAFIGNNQHVFLLWNAEYEFQDIMMLSMKASKALRFLDRCSNFSSLGLIVSEFSHSLPLSPGLLFNFFLVAAWVKLSDFFFF